MFVVLMVHISSPAGGESSGVFCFRLVGLPYKKFFQYYVTTKVLTVTFSGESNVRSVKEAVIKHFEKETLEDGQRVKETRITQYPPYLILNVNRYQYLAEHGVVHKVL